MSVGAQQGSQAQNMATTGNTTLNTSGTSTTNPTANWTTGSNALFGSVGQNGGLSPQQQQASDALTARLTSGNPEWQLNGLNDNITALMGGMNTPTVGTGQVTAPTAASAMAPYEGSYANDVLNPSLNAFDTGVANTNAGIRAQRDAGSAFGDRAAVADSVNATANNTARGALAGQITGQGYQTALGAGQTDVSNALTASNANAGYGLNASNSNASNYLAGNAQKLAGIGQQGSNISTAAGIGSNDAVNLANVGQGGVSNLLALLGSQVPAFGSSTTGSDTGSSSGTSIGTGSSSSKGAGNVF